MLRVQSRFLPYVPFVLRVALRGCSAVGVPVLGQPSCLAGSGGVVERLALEAFVLVVAGSGWADIDGVSIGVNGKLPEVEEAVNVAA